MKSAFDFSHERERECVDAGVLGRWEVGHPKGADGDDTTRLLAEGVITFPGADEFYVQSTEILTRGSGFSRERYGYYLVCTDESLIGRQEIGGFERAEPHGEHMHCGLHVPGGEPYGKISFKDAIQYAWKVIGRIQNGEDDECPPD